MISDIFGGLLLCDSCGHGVGSHETMGCLERACGCAQNRDGVVQRNVETTIDEHLKQWEIGSGPA